MSFSARIEGVDTLRARLETMRANSANLAPALLRSGVAVLKAAQERIDAGGPGWAPLYKGGGGHSMLHVTGRLLASLTFGGTDSFIDADATHVTVGTNVKTDDGGWNLGYLLQYGTGIYAGRSEIKPKTAKFLHWYDGGGDHYAKAIRGMPARPFLYFDEPLKATIRQIFANHVSGGDVSQITVR